MRDDKQGVDQWHTKSVSALAVTLTQKACSVTQLAKTRLVLQHAQGV